MNVKKNSKPQSVLKGNFGFYVCKGHENEYLMLE